MGQPENDLECVLPHSRLIYRVLVVSHLWESKRHQKGKISFTV